MRNVQRDVEDAVPYGMVRTGAGTGLRAGQAPPLRRRICLGAERTAGRRGRRPLRGRPTLTRSRLPFRVSDVGRGKPLPYGDGRTRCETNTGRRDAVPYGMVRKCRRGAQTAGGASPAPTGGDGRFRASRARSAPGHGSLKRDVEDAVPCGMVREYGLPKGKGVRIGNYVMFFLTFLLTKSKICCTLSLGRRSEAPRRRIVRGVVPGDFFAYRSLVRIIYSLDYPFGRISGDSPLFPLGRADLLPVPPPIR